MTTEASQTVEPTVTQITSDSHEAVYRVHAPEVGLTGFIALHSTCRGPAAGGLRMRPYASEDEALTDVLRLSEGMSYKNAAADLPLGGGKAVIIGDPATRKTPALLKSFARAIEGLGGRYWTAEDMGMSPSDMAVLRGETQYVAGLSDGAFASGDPSPVTARGIFNAIRIGARHRFGSEDLAGRRVAVQGLGNVGWNLCGLLAEAGASLIVTDVEPARVARTVTNFGAEAVASDAIYGAEADIFAPCAIGAILNARTIPQLKVKLVAGGANNQLETAADAALLQARGILYAPDYVANGGGIINVASEILRIHNTGPWVAGRLEALVDTMDGLLARAAREGRSPALIADAMMAERLLPIAAE
ncbi:Leucine dehydrogenase [Pseudoruegeria aquimaris]|uniref:Leucine dehydrogenase n=1 Tax=Pseudoruegeria aquimaris TaxID=393663 RepID=A0A1Y5SFC4_9RHOB|nr:Glu/Leu/Phe/Val dehydrogenase dimerization domain-containing protein [Pseudoruegeria aquimaris]SLN39513.1 Leucine dehydrogenase [Pseudoruegeria aquimaris]